LIVALTIGVPKSSPDNPKQDYSFPACGEIHIH
jgi:hypothetical protein